MNIQQFSAEIERISNLSAADSGPYLEKLAPLVARMANSGIGTDHCLNHGCLPLPVHYFSPVPNIPDLQSRRIWSRRSALPGINWDDSGQLQFLATIGRRYGNECRWPAQSTGNPQQFYTENNSFIFGCAAAAHCLIRHFKPKRVIEIGSGFSSLVINEALAQNASESHHCEYTIIDPFPPTWINSGLSHLNCLMGQRVELLEPQFFLKLQSNDLLFIDSGHTVRIGGDVNFLILDVLPRLNPGAVIHFHDISLPYEYPECYLTNASFRMLWTEAYLLQAFLCHNSDFQILLALSWIMTEHPREFQQAFPHYNPAIHHNQSGSLWIRKKEPV